MSDNFSNQKYDIAITIGFDKWLKKQPEQIFSRIATRINRAKKGNLGKNRWFDKIGELKIDFGQGYRLYFTIKEQTVILLLLGGNKNSQDRDIEKARQILKELEDLSKKEVDLWKKGFLKKI